MPEACRARMERAPKRAQILRGKASRAGRPIWKGKMVSGRNDAVWGRMTGAGPGR